MIILVGVAGAGKSYQGKLMADKYGYAWISTGEIFRVLITGARRKEILSGKLLSDKEVIEIVDKVLELIDTNQEFVFDGFPRTEVQANWLLNQVEIGRLKLTVVFSLNANEEVVRSRLINRGRQDDNEKAIRIRFKEYREVTKPILQRFRDNGVRVVDIDASQSPEMVANEIAKAIELN